MSRFFSQDARKRPAGGLTIRDKHLSGIPVGSCSAGCCAGAGGTSQGPQVRGITRRRFIRLSGIAAAVLSAVGLSKIVRSYLSVGPAETAPARFVVGMPADFPPGSVTLEGGIFVMRDDGGLFAVNAACPHLGCRIQWKAGEAVFECPCHGSRYDQSGRYLSGPARKALTPVHLGRNETGQVVADLGRTIRAEHRIREE